ncbi:MAG: hypothetical protein N4A35_07150 [Flavobacteriales bacterium]|jgi:hypothetical protein|nr:hypothetical protein [Flavobacteriales bacterium]
MTKVITSIDLGLNIITPLIAAAYLVSLNNYFSPHIYFVCWLGYIIHITFSMARFKDLASLRWSLLSIANLIFFGAKVALGDITLQEFSISILLSEVGAQLFGIIYLFLFTEGINGKSAWDTFGTGGTLFFVLLFVAINYPILGETVLFIKSSNMNVSVLIFFIITFIFDVKKSIESITAITEKRKAKVETINKDIDNALEGGKSFKELGYEAQTIILTLGVWFLGIGSVYVIYIMLAPKEFIIQ